VTDDGVFRRNPSHQPGDGGRGVSLMKALVDEVSIREGTAQHPGTEVRLVKCCAQSPVR
jgi:anti-sigma regulatory factor (Ser/Thr protein kinase)